MQVPTEVWASVAAVLTAVAYLIRRNVARKPSAEEQARALTLELQVKQGRTLRRIARRLRTLEGRAEPRCPWDHGKVPAQFSRIVEAAVDQTELRTRQAVKEGMQ